MGGDDCYTALQSPLGVAFAAYTSTSGEGDDYGCDLSVLPGVFLGLGPGPYSGDEDCGKGTFLDLLLGLSPGTLACHQTWAHLAFENSALETLEFDVTHSDIAAHTPCRWGVGPWA